MNRLQSADVIDVTGVQYAGLDGEGRAQREDALPADHLIRFRPGGWAFWRCVGLRGAGFPIADALRLATPEAAGAADALLEVERRIEETDRTLLGSINAGLDALREAGRWDRVEERAPLMDARSKVKAGKLPAGDLPPTVAGAVAEARRARDRRAPAGAEFEAGHAAALRRTSQELREIAASDGFREAVTWQNRHALHTAVDPLLSCPEGGPRASKQRQHESLLASYVQRYCVKNDTIGFFGPVGWAELVPEGASLACRPGPSLLAARRTYFEMWGIEALASSLSGQEAFHPWLTPLRNPSVRVDGTTLHHPFYGSIRVPVAEAVILSMCDGARTARDIAKLVLRLPQARWQGDDDVYRLLLDLESRGLVRYGIYIPYNPFPERTLRSWIEGVGDESLRRDALARLDALESARGEVTAAAGNWRALDEALGRLDETFTAVTGASPTRSPGGTYAARTLVYEDCRRDVEVKLGPDLLLALDEPLSLLLQSARWMTVECAAICTRAAKQVYHELVRTDGSPTVDAARFWVRLTGAFFDQGSAAFEPALAELKKRWDALLPADPSARRVFARAADLRPLVEAAFPAAGPAWRTARYHSPDVMIAAVSADAIDRGDFQLVMGECHLSVNTLAASLFVNQHPSPESLAAAAGADLGGGHLVPVEPKDFGDFTARTVRGFVSPEAFRLEWSRESLTTRSTRRLPIAELTIEEIGGELTVRTRDGAHEFRLLDMISDPLGGVITNAFGVLTSDRYVPRRTIDRLVVSRETWRFAPRELGFAFEKKESDRFLGLRRWAHAHGVPRFVFTRIPVERKPYFLDLDSAIYAESFAKLVRRSAEQGSEDDLVTVSEMMPSPDELWLTDAEGRRYVSELRIVAVDPGRHDRAGVPAG